MWEVFNFPHFHAFHKPFLSPVHRPSSPVIPKRTHLASQLHFCYKSPLYILRLYKGLLCRKCSKLLFMPISICLLHLHKFRNVANVAVSVAIQGLWVGLRHNQRIRRKVRIAFLMPYRHGVFPFFVFLVVLCRCPYQIGDFS